MRLCDARAAHLIRVLNVAPGHSVRVGVLDGAIGTGVVASMSDDDVTLRCTLTDPAPPPAAVDLLLALPRPKVMRRLWAQLAAIGVRRIMLTNAERVERNYFDTHVLTPACYQPLLIEGLQQARDTRLPRVSIHRQFRPFVEDEMDGLVGPGLRLVAHPGADRSLAAVAGARARVTLAVGPEGGWNAYELALLDAHGFTPVGMGARTLRTDTACISLLTLVHAAISAPRDRP